MSLQNYDINVAPNKTQEVSAQGRYLYYYEGTTPNITAGTALATSKNQQIKVVAGTTGASVLLMPGQSIRLAQTEKAPSMWKVTNANGVETITGTLLVGDGEFHDSNVANTFKLDATFANSVQVTNTAGSPVPVSVQNSSLEIANDVGNPVPVTIQNSQIEIMNDTGNRIPVTLDPAQTLNIATSTMAYTTAYTSNAGSVGGTAIQMLAAGTNVNGVVLNKFSLQAGASGSVFAVLAKATAPANIIDGDVLFVGNLNSASVVAMDATKDGQPKVPAGKGIWYLCNTADTATLRSALFTVL